jgi:hypothetical protein
MTTAAAKTYETFSLPPNVVSRVDVSRLVSEVERVDNELTAAAVRGKIGEAEQPTPVLSQQLADFLAQNQLVLTEGHERSRIVKELRTLKDKVPVIHMTFAVTADPESLAQIAAWLRQSVHPQAVISVGLQPSLVAGVYLRTPNHVHDLSLKAKLASSRGVLVKELESYRGK